MSPTVLILHDPSSPDALAEIAASSSGGLHIVPILPADV
jgi:hypothetical protein